MEHWSSRTAFLFAAIGSAVGIGNIWRFSSVVGQNGGGAYLVPYLLAVFCFAVPLMILELAVGKRYRGNVVSSFERVRPRLKYIGWFIWAVVLVILSYYLVITGWTLAFFVNALSGESLTFEALTSSLQPVYYFVLTALITSGVILLGVRKGIEKLVTVMIPFIFLIMLILAGVAVTLPGFADGARFFFKPDFSVLLDPLLWSAAFGQTFFSLSVGFGALITYGAYLNQQVNLVKYSFIIAIADLGVAFLAGFIIFPFVFTFGLQPTLGTELAFTTLPAAFTSIQNGHLLGIAFFALLFAAALTSAIGMLEVNAAALMQQSGLSRTKAVLLLTPVVLVLGLFSALSYSSVNLEIVGVRVLDFADETIGTIGLLFSAFFTATVFTWLISKSEGKALLGSGILWAAAKYAIPAVLGLVILTKIVANLDFPGWHLLPEAVDLIPRPVVVAIIAVVAMLLFFYRKKRDRK